MGKNRLEAFSDGVIAIIITIAAAIPLSFVSRWIAFGLCAVVAVMWVVPDRRIEKKLNS